MRVGGLGGNSGDIVGFLAQPAKNPTAQTATMTSVKRFKTPSNTMASED